MHLRDGVISGLIDDGRGGWIRDTFQAFVGGRGHGGTGTLFN